MSNGIITAFNMNRQPAVSIIVPNYNHAPFLRQRLDSIYNQSFQDFEVILLDDASTDESISILKEYAVRPHTRLVTNQRNSGSPFAQWNKGISLAQGHYAWFAESDDVADPDFLQTLVGVLNTHPHVGLAHCDSWLIAADGTPSGKTASTNVRQKYQLTDYESDFVLEGPLQIIRNMVRCNAIMNASAVLFRTALYRSVGGANPAYRLCGDIMLWINLLEQCAYAYVHRPLNHWRWHTGTARHSAIIGGRVLAEQVRVLRYIHARHAISAEELLFFMDVFAQSMPGTLNHARADWLRNLPVPDVIDSISLRDFLMAAPVMLRRCSYRLRQRIMMQIRRVSEALWRRMKNDHSGP